MGRGRRDCNGARKPLGPQGVGLAGGGEVGSGSCSLPTPSVGGVINNGATGAGMWVRGVTRTQARREREGAGPSLCLSLFRLFALKKKNTLSLSVSMWVTPS